MQNPRFDFSNIFEDEIKPKTTEEAKNDIDSIAANARACLNTQVFDKYRKQYEEMLPKLMDIMLQYTVEFRRAEISLEQYAVNMACYCTKISDLRALLKTVEAQAKNVSTVEPPHSEP